MKNEFEQLSLANVGKGVANELFANELIKVMDNIVDLNTDSKDARKIILEISFVPNLERTQVLTKVKCTSRLAGVMPASGFVDVVNNHGQPVLVQNVVKQDSLFDNSNVESFVKKGQDIAEKMDKQAKGA